MLLSIAMVADGGVEVEETLRCLLLLLAGVSSEAAAVLWSVVVVVEGELEEAVVGDGGLLWTPPIESRILLTDGDV